MNRLDLRSLSHFVAICREGGFARASRVLHHSQPSLTRSIRQLEEVLGVSLFQRSARGTVITEAGKRLLPHATAVLNEADRAASLFAPSNPASTVRRVAIGVSPSLFEHGMPDVLRELLASMPDLGIVLRQDLFEAMLTALRERAIELAVSVVPAGDPILGRSLTGLSFEELARDRFVPVAAPDHALFAADATLAEAGRHGWAVPHQMSLSWSFEGVFLRHGQAIPAQRLNASSIRVLEAAATDMGLIAMLPLIAVGEAVAAGRLRILELDELHIPYMVGLITPSTLSPGAAPVVALLRERFATAFATDGAGDKSTSSSRT